MLTGKTRGLSRTKPGRSSAKDSPAGSAESVKGMPMRGKPLAATLEVTSSVPKSSVSPKSASLKGKSLALEGLKGPSPASPKTGKTLEAPRQGAARVSPRGKALSEAPPSGGASLSACLLYTSPSPRDS